MGQLQSPEVTPVESPYLAQHWFMRLRAPDCTEHDRAAFARWQQVSASHVKAYDDFVEQWAELEWDVHRCEGAEHGDLGDSRGQIGRSRPARRFVWQGAATLALAFFKG